MPGTRFRLNLWSCFNDRYLYQPVTLGVFSRYTKYRV